MDPEVLKAIEASLKKGNSIDDIKAKLKSVGYSDEELSSIDEIYKKKRPSESQSTSVPTQDTSASEPKPAQDSAPKDVPEQFDLFKKLEKAPPLPEGASVESQMDREMSKRPSGDKRAALIDIIEKNSDPIEAGFFVPSSEEEEEVIDYKRRAESKRKAEEQARPRSPYAYEIVESLKDNNNEMFMSSLRSYIDLHPDLKDKDIDPSDPSVMKMIEDDANLFYRDNIKSIIEKKTGGSSIASDLFSSMGNMLGEGVLGILAAASDLNFHLQPIREAMREADIRKPDGSAITANEVIDPRIYEATIRMRERAGENIFNAQIKSGMTQEQIEKGGLLTAIEDGNFVGLGISVLSQAPNIAISIAARDKKKAIATMSALAGGSAYSGVIDDPDFSFEEKFMYAMGNGAAEAILSSFFDTDTKQLTRFGRKMISNRASQKTASEISKKTSKKNISDTLFGPITSSNSISRVVVEEFFEELLVSVVDQSMQAAISGRPMSTLEAVESGVIGALTGFASSSLVKAPSALLNSRIMVSKIEIDSRISKINKMLQDESVSETEKKVLEDELKVAYRSRSKMRKEAERYYRDFSQEDIEKTIKLDQSIRNSFELYNSSEINEVKQGALKQIKEAVAEKKAIEQGYVEARREAPKKFVSSVDGGVTQQAVEGMERRMQNAEEIDISELESTAESLVKAYEAAEADKSLRPREKAAIMGAIETKINELLDYELATTTRTKESTETTTTRGVVPTPKEGVRQTVSRERFEGKAAEVDGKPAKIEKDGEALSLVSEDGTKKPIDFNFVEFDSSSLDADGNLSVTLRDNRDGSTFTIKDNDLALDVAISESQRQIGTVPEGTFQQVMRQVAKTTKSQETVFINEGKAPSESALKGRRKKSYSVTEENASEVIDELSDQLDDIPDEDFKMLGTSRSKARAGLISIESVMASLAKAGIKASLTIHASEKSFLEAVGGNELSRGMHVVSPKGSSQIHIYLPAMIENTAYHEAMHELIPDVFGEKAINRVADRLLTEINKDSYLAVKFNKFLESYKESEQADELITEVAAMVASGDIEIKVKQSVIGKFVNAMADIFGFKVNPDVDQMVEALDFMANRLSDGGEIDVAEAKKMARTDRAVGQKIGSKAQDVIKTKEVPVEYAPKGNYLNVGMVAGTTNQPVTSQMITDALPSDVSVEESFIKEAQKSELDGQESEEPTMVLKLSRPLTDNEMQALLDATDQIAIPAIYDGVGQLFGSDRWGDFNPEFFSMLDGNSLEFIGIKLESRKAQKVDLKTEGVSFKLKGNELTKAGKNMPTVYLGKNSTMEDYTMSEFFPANHAPNSSVVSFAVTLASGVLTYKGKKGKKSIPLFYENKDIEKRISRLRGKYSSIDGGTKEGKSQRSKVSAEINKLTRDVYEQVGAMMTENILALYDSATQEFLSRSKEWYVGANRISNELSSVYGISIEQSSGILASLSPQKAWFDNIALADRVMNATANEFDTIVDSSIIEKAVKYNTSTKGEPSNWAKNLKASYDANGDVSISKLASDGKMIAASLYLRAIDQAINPQKVLNIDPEGTFRGITSTKLKWSGSTDIIKAMNIFLDQNSISEMLGKGNKVRNFYNNIVDPYSENPYVTADTHAGSVGLMAPMSANDVGALGLFAQGKSPVYVLVKSAYEQAAKIAGIQPREMQSITWEIQRTGVNNDKRTEKEKNETFSLIQSLKNEGITQYEKATRILSGSRSASPQWDTRINVQRPVSELLQGVKDRAISRSRDAFDVWRGLSRGGDSSVDSRPSVKSKKAQAITSETSANYANLTEDGNGNFVFYHFSDQSFDAPDPSRAGQNRSNITSREEKVALSTAGPVAMFYTDINNREGLVSSEFGYEVRVPAERVYDLDADPLNFEAEARERFKKDNPDQAFGASHRAFAITAVAAENGFDMTVGRWTRGLSRAHSAIKLPVTDRMIARGKNKKGFNESFESNSDKGWAGVSPSDGMSKVYDAYSAISMERNEQKKYDEVYRLYYEYGKYSQGEITDMINSSDLSSESKKLYKGALASVPSGYQSVQRKAQAISKKAQGPIKDVKTVELAQTAVLWGTKRKDGGYDMPMTEDDYVYSMIGILPENQARVVYKSVKNGSAFVDNVEAAKRSLDELQKKLKTQERTKFERLLSGFIDSQRDLKKLLIKADMNGAYSLLVTRAGHGAIAKHFSTQYERDVYKGLSKEEIQALDKIVFARRVIQVDTNADAQGKDRPMHPAGPKDEFLTKESAEMSLLTIEKNLGTEVYEKLLDRSDRYFNAFRAMLKRSYDSGIITEESYNMFVGFDYQPRRFFEHVIDFGEHIPSDFKAGAQQNLLKAIKNGSFDPAIMDSRYLMVVYTKSLEARIANNNVRKAVAEAALDDKNKDWARVTKSSSKAPSQFQDVPNGWVLVNFFDKGIQDAFLLREDLFPQISNAGRIEMINHDLATKIAWFSGSRILKTIATATNPLFVLTNLPRDYFHVLLFTDRYDGMDMFSASVKLAIDASKGIYAHVRKTPLYEDWIMHGGGMDFLATQGRESVIGIAGQRVGNALSFLGETSEAAFRIAVYQRTLSKMSKENGGVVTEEMKVHAAAKSREIIDFAQGGTVTKDAENVMPYVNAAFQGFRVATNYIANNPAMFAAKIAQVSVGVLGLALLNMSMAEDDELEKIPEYIKQNYFVVLTPKRDKEGKRIYVKIAKTQQARVFLTPIENIMYGAAAEITGKKIGKNYHGEYNDVGDALIQVSETYLPVDVLDASRLASSINPILGGILTYSNNYDAFRDQVISREMGSVMPQLEGIENPNIPVFYKAIGEMTSRMSPSGKGASPARLKAATEKVITSPSSSLTVGVAYSMLDLVTRQFDVEIDGSISNPKINETSNPVAMGLWQNIQKKAVGRVDDRYQSTNFRKEFESIDMRAGSKRKEIDILTKKIGQEYSDSGYSREAASKVRSEFKALMGKMKDDTDIKYATSRMNAVISKKNYPSVYDDIRWSASDRARAEKIMVVTGKMSKNELADFYKRVATESGYSLPAATIYEYKKLAGIK